MGELNGDRLIAETPPRRRRHRRRHGRHAGSCGGSRRWDLVWSGCIGRPAGFRGRWERRQRLRLKGARHGAGIERGRWRLLLRERGRGDRQQYEQGGDKATDHATAPATVLRERVLQSQDGFWKTSSRAALHELPPP